VLKIRKDYFFGGGAGAGAGGRRSVIYRDKLPTLRVRFGFVCSVFCFILNLKI
jgi:hypothetical protein